MIPDTQPFQSIVAAVLGPRTDLGEDRLESYNRAYNIIRAVGYLSTKSRWKETIGKTPFPDRAMHPTWIPQWMVALPKAPLATAETPKLRRKKIILVHDLHKKTKHTADLRSHIENHVDAEGLTMPAAEMLAAKDPRVFESGEQWRDTVRRQLSMQHLRVEFFTIHLVHSSTENEDRIMLFGPAQASLSSWKAVQHALLQTDLEARFVYTLRPLEEGEEFDTEYSGPPIALEDDLRIGPDGDIEGIPTVSEEGNEVQVDEKEQAENRAFLSGGGRAVRKAPVPESEFTAADRERMLEQHDGFDVMTTAGLRQWQEFVIDIVAYAHGPQLKLAKDIPFKGNSKISKAQRDALIKWQEGGEKLALATDVSHLSGLISYQLQINLKVDHSLTTYADSGGYARRPLLRDTKSLYRGPESSRALRGCV